MNAREKVLHSKINALLYELTQEEDLEKSILSLVTQLAATKISYYQSIDLNFQLEKGLSYEEYYQTKSEEWDGTDWKKIEDFHKWDDAISGIEYYKEILNQCNFQNLENK